MGTKATVSIKEKTFRKFGISPKKNTPLLLEIGGCERDPQKYFIRN